MNELGVQTLTSNELGIQTETVQESIGTQTTTLQETIGTQTTTLQGTIGTQTERIQVFIGTQTSLLVEEHQSRWLDNVNIPDSELLSDNDLSEIAVSNENPITEVDRIKIPLPTSSERMRLQLLKSIQFKFPYLNLLKILLYPFSLKKRRKE